MKTIFKLVVLALLLWGAYEYGYRNCENDYKLSMEQAKKDVSELTEQITDGIEDAIEKVKSDTNAAKTE